MIQKTVCLDQINFARSKIGFTEVRNVPLPQVPRGQSAKSRIQVTTIPAYYATPYVVPTYVSPRSLVESAAYAFSPAWHAIAINT